MNNILKRIDELIKQVYTKLKNQLEYDEKGELRFVDPNDHREISAHYGASHFAASLLILGNKYADSDAYSKGKELLKSILTRWPQENKLPAYHYDFNNFAFLLCYSNLKPEDAELKDFAKQTVIDSPDSNHYTINWLPMRMIVNNMRYRWTGEDRFKKISDSCICHIKNATNSDGGIEDRLPKGVSFNLQYDISTLATLLYAKELVPDYEFERSLEFLLENLAPDGDINYQGRGCNQIFAWGPWIYILCSYGKTIELGKSLDYLQKYLTRMLNNNSMMLNDWPGTEKYLWWDYHYASVYSAHLLLWLLLARLNFNKYRYQYQPNDKQSYSTGLAVQKSENYFISVFNGREEYLAEKGPSIALLWTKKYGSVVKGCFGPWRGLFGNKNTFGDVVLLNYCGLIRIKQNKQSGIIQRIKHRILPLSSNSSRLIKSPLFCPIKISEDKRGIVITWRNENNESCLFNLPSLSENLDFKLFVDNNQVPLTLIGTIRNQYDLVRIFQSKVADGSEWTLVIG